MKLTHFRVLFGVDFRTLALFRVCLACLVLFDVLNRSRMISAFYTDEGVLPRSAALAHGASWRFSLHFLNGHFEYQVALFIVTALAALALLGGYRTRLATFVCWVLIVSLDNRNRLLLQDGDQLLVVLLFWSLFLPLSARFSVDSALNSAKRPQENTCFSIGTMALLLQCAYVYVFGALLKTSPVWMPDGTAVYWALHRVGPRLDVASQT